MNSLMGKILFVDLSVELVKTGVTSRKWIELYGGQKGLGTRLLMEEFDPRTDAYAPENRVVLSTSIMGEQSYPPPPSWLLLPNLH